MNWKRAITIVSLGLLFGLAACQAVEDPPPDLSDGSSTAEPGQVDLLPTQAFEEPVAYPEPIEEVPVQAPDPYPEPEFDLTYAASLNPDYAPLEMDAQYQRGMAFVNSTDLFMLESYPVQVQLQLMGEIPTPCHELRVLVSKPDAQNRIEVEVYTVVDPGLICIQVTEAFDIVISLGAFTDGDFTIWLNGEQIEAFTLP